MGVDCKGFVLTRNKDVFFVVARIEKAINRLILERSGARSILDLNRLKTTDGEGSPLWKTVTVEFASMSRMLHINFTFNGEVRRLAAFFDCDCDHTEYGPYSLSFSLGCWGASELLMTTALSALSMLGPCYIDVNDSDDKDPERLPVAPLTYAQACELGHATSSTLCFEEWVSTYNSLDAKERPALEEFMGLPAAVLEPVLHYLEDRDRGGWEEMNELLEQATAMVATAKAA